MENENMDYNYEEVEVLAPEAEIVEMEPECADDGKGFSMLKGAGLAIVVMAVGKLAKKAWLKHKVKKAQEETDYVDAEAAEEEPTDGEVVDETK